LNEIGAGQIVIASETRRETHRVQERLILTGDDGVLVRLD
jgi:hypothetical protein